GIEALRSRVPQVAGPRGRALGHGRRGEVASGFVALQIDAAALSSRTPEGIDADLLALGVKVYGRMAERGLLVRVPGNAVESLAQAGFVEAAMPWEAEFRIDPALARNPMVQRSRALSDDLALVLDFFEGADMAAAKRDVERIAGHVPVDYSLD